MDNIIYILIIHIPVSIILLIYGVLRIYDTINDYNSIIKRNEEREKYGTKSPKNNSTLSSTLSPLNNNVLFSTSNITSKTTSSNNIINFNGIPITTITASSNDISCNMNNSILYYIYMYFKLPFLTLIPTIIRYYLFILPLSCIFKIIFSIIAYNYAFSYDTMFILKANGWVTILLINLRIIATTLSLIFAYTLKNSLERSLLKSYNNSEPNEKYEYIQFIIWILLIISTYILSLMGYFYDSRFYIGILYLLLSFAVLIVLLTYLVSSPIIFTALVKSRTVFAPNNKIDKDREYSRTKVELKDKKAENGLRSRALTINIDEKPATPKIIRNNCDTLSLERFPSDSPRESPSTSPTSFANGSEFKYPQESPTSKVALIQLSNFDRGGTSPSYDGTQSPKYNTSSGKFNVNIESPNCKYDRSVTAPFSTKSKNLNELTVKRDVSSLKFPEDTRNKNHPSMSTTGVSKSSQNSVYIEQKLEELNRRIVKFVVCSILIIFTCVLLLYVAVPPGIALVQSSNAFLPIQIDIFDIQAICQHLTLIVGAYITHRPIRIINC